MSLALWLTNPGHQSRSVNILSWIFHTHTLRLLLYPNGSQIIQWRFSVFRTYHRKAQSQNSATWDSLLFLRNGWISHLKTVLSLPPNPVTFPPYHITNQLIYLRSYHHHYESYLIHHHHWESDGTTSNHQTSVYSSWQPCFVFERSRTHITSPQTAEWSSILFRTFCRQVS